MNILFVCTGNSCRSQMAEGWARFLHRDLKVYSAGIEAHGLNPHAVAVMAEAGVDISNQQSQLVSELLNIPFDLVVTVCGHADKHCPVFPSAAPVVHRPFDDPPRLAALETSPEAALNHYRRVRDDIREMVATIPDLLEQS